jgi:hypothetical protein
MLGITQPMSSKFPNFLSLYLSIYIIEKYWCMSMPFILTSSKPKYLFQT